MEKILEGLVKGVPSGDTVFISGKVDKMSDKAPEEYHLSFNLVMAPRCATSNNKDEEPYGWEARSFLRGLVLGKVVRYTIDYKSGERCIGSVFFGDKNINLEVVKRGFAKVAGINKQNESFTKSEYYSKLQNFESEAKKNKLNIWGEKTELEKHKRVLTKWDDKEFDWKKVETFCLGKEVEVMVDHVINCAGYVILIKELNCFVRFNPRFLAIPSNTNEPLIYKSGKAFVERFILHKDLKVKIHQRDQSNNLVGDIITDPKKSDLELVLSILKGGYTKVYTGSHNVSNDEMTLLKNAQQFAMNERLRLWKNHTDTEGVKISSNSSVKSTDKSSFEGVCLGVHSGDSISVKHKTTGEMIRLFLSHLKAPKLANPNSNEPDQPWAWQAKEYLRKNYVGKKVYCEYDFTRVVTDNKDSKSTERQMNFFSVTKISEKEGHSDVNINADLISHGYANYVTPKVDEHNTSKYLDLYTRSFSEARDKKVGLHSSKSPGNYNYSDLFAANKQKVKEFKEFLVGQKNAPCVIEHVITGGRVKLRIESKKIMIPFNLLGIKTFSKDANNTEICQKLYQAGVDFGNDHILQREGTCDIIQGDRMGNYFGYLTVNGENYAANLIRAGLAVVNVGMAGNFSQLNNYKKAEEEAISKKLNIWKYDGLVSMLKDGGDDSTSTTTKLKEISVDSLAKVSEFVDFREFYINLFPNKELDKICEVLSDYDVGKKKPISLEPPIRKGLLCAAKYYNDDQYYRAVTLRTFKDDKHEVEFIDYGTIEEIAGSDLIKLDSTIASFKPQAVSCELAYLKFSDQAMKKALVTFKNFGLSIEKQYFAKLVYSYSSDSREKCGAIIYNTKDKSIKNSLQYELLELGLAKLDKKKPPQSAEKDALLEAEKKAKTKGVGMWLDNEKSDDEEEI